ncbi:MAG: hypothetical protein AAGM22_19675 [Acidobacteriota bacterium]
MAVFTFDSITLEVDVTIVGSRPVALLSKSSLVIHGAIFVGAGVASAGPGGFDGGVGVGAGPGGGGGPTGLNGGAGGAGGAGHGTSGQDGAGPQGGDGGVVYGDLRDALIGGSSGGVSVGPIWTSTTIPTATACATARTPVRGEMMESTQTATALPTSVTLQS